MSETEGVADHVVRWQREGTRAVGFQAETECRNTGRRDRRSRPNAGCSLRGPVGMVPMPEHRVAESMR
jgi:hypothetical protein